MIPVNQTFPLSDCFFDFCKNVYALFDCFFELLHVFCEAVILRKSQSNSLIEKRINLTDQFRIKISLVTLAFRLIKCLDNFQFWYLYGYIFRLVC